MATMRDAATDPESGDFLPPVSGVSPGIHANQGVHPVTPGVVSDTAATQETAENKHMASFQSDEFTDALAVTPATKSVVVEATQQLVATATFSDESTTMVVTSDTAWESDDEAKATVDVDGLVTAVAQGEATITGTYRGQTDTSVITVTAT